MRKLSTITALALAAATAAGAALPAQAQPYPDHRYDRNDRGYDRGYDRNWQGGHARGIWQQIEDLQRRVERNDGRDRISEREAAGLRRDVWRLREQFRDFSRNGLSQREAQILQARIHNVRQRLQFERRDRDGRRW